MRLFRFEDAGCAFHRQVRRIIAGPVNVDRITDRLHIGLIPSRLGVWGLVPELLRVFPGKPW